MSAISRRVERLESTADSDGLSALTDAELESQLREILTPDFLAWLEIEPVLDDPDTVELRSLLREIGFINP